MNNKVIKSGGLLALSGLILVSLIACKDTSAGTQTPAPGAKPGNMAPAVTAADNTTKVKRGDIALSVTTDGRLSFVDDRALTFGTSGKVDQIKVNELDKVTKGQVLTKLDTTSLEQAVKAAGLALKSAEIDRSVAEDAVKSAQSDLIQVQNSVKSAGIDLEVADTALRKMTYPYTTSTFAFDIPAAIQSIHDAQLALDLATAGLQAGPGSPSYGDAMEKFRQAQDNLKTAQQRLLVGQGIVQFTDPSQTKIVGGDIFSVRTAQLAVEKAQVTLDNAQNAVNKSILAVNYAKNAASKAQVAVDKAKNDLDAANDTLSKAIIVAPFDGIVAKINVEVGDFLTTGNYATSAAVEVVDPARMELDVNVNEIDVPYVKMGQKVSIIVGALPDVRFEGVVISIGTLPVAQSGVMSYLVKTAFDVPKESGLKAGMGATAAIVNQRSNVLLLPSSAVKRDAGGRSVVQVSVKGQIQDRPVVTGISDGKQIEIVKGLEEGEIVVAKTGA